MSPGRLWAFIKTDLKKIRLLLLHRRLYISSKNERDITTRFHRMFFDSHIFETSWDRTSWLGVKTLKCPLDMWIYQEIIHEVRPDLIIECGTAHGGSALYLATICDAVDKGRIVTIDIGSRPGPKPRHERIEYLTGSSTSDEIVTRVEKLKPGDKEMALLDSDHKRPTSSKRCASTASSSQRAATLSSRIRTTMDTRSTPNTAPARWRPSSSL